MEPYNQSESIRHIKPQIVKRITLTDRRSGMNTNRKKSEILSGNTHIPTPKLPNQNEKGNNKYIYFWIKFHLLLYINK